MKSPRTVVDPSESQLRSRAPAGALAASGGSGLVISGTSGASGPQDGPADDSESSPRSVIRGERSPLVEGHIHPQSAFTDYLTVTFPLPSDEGVRPEARIVDRVGYVFCGALGCAIDRERGMFGFTRSFAFDRYGAILALGGNRGRAMLSLPGEACAAVPSWLALVELLRDEWNGRITRWDGARDELEGQFAVDDAVRWYCEGGFNAGGKRPECSQMGNWLTEDTKGRTFYVGSRKNGKLCRIYEKGKQLGDPRSPWVRFEVELHNKDRVIPFRVLLEPGAFVAGAYPCLRWVSDKVSRIATIANTATTSYDALIRHARNAYGQLIDTAEVVEGSAEAAIQRLKRPGFPKRLEMPDVPEHEGFPP